MVTGSTEVKEAAPIEEVSGKLAPSPEDKRLMRTVLESDKEAVDDAYIILEAINQGIGSLTPELLFEQIVRNYKLAKQLLGETLLRALTGYEPNQIERNLHLPEFQQEIRQRLTEKVSELKRKRLLDKEYGATEQAVKLATLLLYTEELDRLKAQGLGEKEQKKPDKYGYKESIKPFSHDTYRDVAIRKTLSRAIKRGRTELAKEDLMSFERQARGKNQIIYALDASGSMKGKKLEQCKKAGIALAYKATQENDSVGLIVFGKGVRTGITPTNKLAELLPEITKARAIEQTDIAATIQKAAEMFKSEEANKHLIIITDALPTAGPDPERSTLEAVAEATEKNVTISIIGVNLDEDGIRLAQKIVEISRGRLLVAKEAENIDLLVLEDYYTI